MEKDDLGSKVKNLENKLLALQYDLNKKERDSYNKDLSENTEKHLSNLCQTLTNQLEDLRVQARLSEDKCKRLESEQNSKLDRLENYKFVLRIIR